jgi:hypothetical protein
MRDYDKPLNLNERRPILERDKYTCQDCEHHGQPKTVRSTFIISCHTGWVVSMSRRT